MSARASGSPGKVSLRRLFPLASFVGCADIQVLDATERSDECGPNMLFAAIRGSRLDGIQFVDEAIRHGAAAILSERPLPGVAVPQCIVSNVRKAYAELWSALCGYPSRRLRIAGVTGTNGKTTVSWLIRSILQTAAVQTGVLGTVEYHDGRRSRRATLTTPDSKTLSQWLEQMLHEGTTHAAIELSSHALDQQRAGGTRLDAAVVTNITQDHFDYHKDFAAYVAAKARIIEQCQRHGVVVLNADDPGSSSLRERVANGNRLLTFGQEQPADITAVIVDESLNGSHFALHTPQGEVEVRSALVGRHNVSNCLAAAAVAIHFGVGLDDIRGGLEAMPAVRGRLERVDCGQPFDVFVDYAHTDDALRRCVSFLQTLTTGRVICVFGAGGDRDRTKRPLLAKAAAQADVVVVTSDNPRTERPENIIADILGGFHGTGIEPHIEADRSRAIQWALAQAEPGDTVLVAGKGHEIEQIIGIEKIPFDDRDVIRGVLEEAPRVIPFVRERIRA